MLQHQHSFGIPFWRSVKRKYYSTSHQHVVKYNCSMFETPFYVFGWTSILISLCKWTFHCRQRNSRRNETYRIWNWNKQAMCHTPRAVGSVLQASSKKIKCQALNLASHSATLKLGMNFVTEFQREEIYLQTFWITFLFLVFSGCLETCWTSGIN